MARRPPRRTAGGAGRCQASGKIRYRDAISAGRVQERLADQGRHVRPYLCPHCSGWHHTTIHHTEEDAA